MGGDNDNVIDYSFPRFLHQAKGVFSLLFSFSSNVGWKCLFTAIFFGYYVRQLLDWYLYKSTNQLLLHGYLSPYFGICHKCTIETIETIASSY